MSRCSFFWSFSLERPSRRSERHSGMTLTTVGSEGRNDGRPNNSVWCRGGDFHDGDVRARASTSCLHTRLCPGLLVGEPVWLRGWGVAFRSRGGHLVRRGGAQVSATTRGPKLDLILDYDPRHQWARGFSESRRSSATARWRDRGVKQRYDGGPQCLGRGIAVLVHSCGDGGAVVKQEQLSTNLLGVFGAGCPCKIGE